MLAWSTRALLVPPWTPLGNDKTLRSHSPGKETNGLFRKKSKSSLSEPSNERTAGLLEKVRDAVMETRISGETQQEGAGSKNLITENCLETDFYKSAKPLRYNLQGLWQIVPVSIWLRSQALSPKGTYSSSFLSPAAGWLHTGL